MVIQMRINKNLTGLEDFAKYSFKISSNNGESSSIFEFNEYVHHLYPKLNLQTSRQIELTSCTLDSIIKKYTLVRK
jgi:hypothetical protein